MHIRDWVDCKLCKGGKFDCDTCKKGLQKCKPCRGRGKLERACDDCAGVGQLPNPALLEPNSCPWCKGSGERDCRTCDDGGLVELGCSPCLDSGRTPCESCKGLGERACAKCGGRGRFGPAKEKCPDCRQKGVRPCTDCERGTVTCTVCLGNDAPRACHDCGGKRRHACNGCALGAYTAWERTAEWLHAAGHQEQGLAWANMALQRCVLRYSVTEEAVRDSLGEAAKRLDSSEAFLKAIEKEGLEEQQRLRKLIKRLED